MSLANKFIEAVEPQLSRALSAVRRIEQYLGPDDDWVERLRRKIWVAADPILRPLGRRTVNVKSDADYITSTDASAEQVEKAIHPRYERNTASTRKARYIDENIEWAVGSWVYDPVDEPWQHHIYFFENEHTANQGSRNQNHAPHDSDGGTDIYGHKEISVRDPSGHVIGGEQVHGDPDGFLRSQLSDAAIGHEPRDLEHPSVPYPTVK